MMTNFSNLTAGGTGAAACCAVFLWMVGSLNLLTTQPVFAQSASADQNGGVATGAAPGRSGAPESDAATPEAAAGRSAVGSGASAGGPAIPEIVVTTRKKAEKLQDVPLAITALNQEDLEARAVQSLSDVALQTPGLSFESFSTGTFGTPVIRGLSQSDITSPLPNVSTFVDGIYLQRPYSVDLGVFDLQRIEVVKGPQSALYGRNAFAGAINYVTRTPADHWGLNITTTIGSAGRGDISGRMDLPLSEWASLAVTTAVSNFDGTWTNNYPNVGQTNPHLSRVGGYDNQAYRIALALTPMDGTRIDLAFYDLEKHTEPGANYFVSSADQTRTTKLECGPQSAPYNFICSTLSVNPLKYANASSTRLPGVVLDPQAEFTNTTTKIYRVRIEQQINNALTLSYLFGQVEAEAFSITEGDWNPLRPGLTLAGTLNYGKGPAGTNNITSNELRLDISPDGPLTGAVGLYYALTHDRSVGENIFLPLGTPLSTVDVGSATMLSNLTRGTGGSLLEPISFPLEDGSGEDSTVSGFGSVTYKLLEDRLRLTAEGRYTIEKRDASWQVYVPSLGGLTPFSGTKTYHQPAPRFSADYKITSQNSVYASVARGIKSGGFNFAAGLPEEQTFGPEENWTYELGSKNTFLDRRLIVNADIYYVDWSNMAIRVQSTPPPFANISGAISEIIGAAHVLGAEFEGKFLLTDALALNYGLSLSDPVFASGVKGFRADGLCSPDANHDGVPDGGAPCLLLNDAATGKNYTLLAGHTLPRTPTTKGNLGLQWDGSLPWGDYFLRGDVLYQSKQYVEEFNLATIQARTLVNTSAGFSHGGWRTQFTVKNLFDKEYVANAFFIYIPNLGAATYVPTLGERRTFFVTTSFSF